MPVHLAVVWLDHQEAHIYHTELHGIRESTIRADPVLRAHQAHPRRNRAGDEPFFQAVANALGEAQDILVFGPWLAKVEFLQHARAFDPALAQKIVRTELMDRSEEGPVVAEARHSLRGSLLPIEALLETEVV